MIQLTPWGMIRHTCRLIIYNSDSKQAKSHIIHCPFELCSKIWCWSTALMLKLLQVEFFEMDNQLSPYITNLIIWANQLMTKIVAHIYMQTWCTCLQIKNTGNSRLCPTLIPTQLVEHVQNCYQFSPRTSW